MRTRFPIVGAVLAAVLTATSSSAQSAATTNRPPQSAAYSPATVVAAPTLDSLVQLALRSSPVVVAAAARTDAARARVGPASALPDPMLMLGIINQPLGSIPATSGADGTMTSASGPDPMTMRMVGVSQVVPYPGRRALLSQSATFEVQAAEAGTEAARRQVVRDVKSAYYELAFIDQAVRIVERSRDVVISLVTLTESRYTVGSAGQQDVLKARVEAARLAQMAAGLAEERRAMAAQLNALLDQPADSRVPAVDMPATISRAAVASSPESVRFSSTAFGSRVADSPLRPLAELQELALRQAPELREQDAMLGAADARLQLARRATLPDVELSVQYGQRGGGQPDMVTATVSLPLPVFRGRKQGQGIVEADAQVATLRAERRGRSNTIGAEVARLVAEIERERTTLALLLKAIVPQGRAALTSATASYQVGKVEFLAVLESQTTVFSAETEYFRALSNFAIKVAELERLVGQEVMK